MRPGVVLLQGRSLTNLDGELERAAVSESERERHLVGRDPVARGDGQPDHERVGERARRAGGQRPRCGQDGDRPASRFKWTRGTVAAVYLVRPADLVAVRLRVERPVRLELD